MPQEAKFGDTPIVLVSFHIFQISSSVRCKLNRFFILEINFCGGSILAEINFWKDKVLQNFWMEFHKFSTFFYICLITMLKKPPKSYLCFLFQTQSLLMDSMDKIMKKGPRTSNKLLFSYKTISEKSLFYSFVPNCWTSQINYTKRKIIKIS